MSEQESGNSAAIGIRRKRVLEIHYLNFKFKKIVIKNHSKIKKKLLITMPISNARPANNSPVMNVFSIMFCKKKSLLDVIIILLVILNLIQSFLIIN